jgi:hypothetical protein
MEFHPAANLFPLMGEAELRELADDIREHGLNRPITTFEGMILDGRNRFLACQQIGKPPICEEWQGGGSPVAWVLSENLHRRHLTINDRARIGLEALPMLEAEAKERQRAAAVATNEKLGREAGDAFCIDTKSVVHADTQAAALVGIGQSTLSRAKAIKEHAPEVWEQVAANEKPVNTAYREAQAQGLVPSRAPRPAPKPRPAPEVVVIDRSGEAQGASASPSPNLASLSPAEELLFRFRDQLVVELFQQHPQLTWQEWSAVADKMQRRLQKVLRCYDVLQKEQGVTE